MGMYDDLRCDYPLPAKGANALTYQTKDTPEQYCELYVITKDGYLEHELERATRKFELCDFTGEIRFYDLPEGLAGPGKTSAWIEFTSYFIRGKLQSVSLLKDTRTALGADSTIGGVEK